MAWHLALMAAPLVMNLGTSIFSLFKSRKANKKVKAQMAAVRAQQQQEMARMMGGFQGQNVGAVGGMNRNYMAPSGLGQNYGPAPAGYYPPQVA